MSFSSASNDDDTMANDDTMALDNMMVDEGDVADKHNGESKFFIWVLNIEVGGISR